MNFHLPLIESVSEAIGAPLAPETDPMIYF